VTDIHLDVAGEARLHRALRQCWHPVARSSEVADKPVAVSLLDERLVVVRLGDEIACFPDLCVHRGTALSLGWVDSGDQPAPDGSGTVGEPCLVCAYHGWSYDRRGVVRRIPAVHGRSIPNRARVTRYATTEAVGLVWVLLEPGPGGWEDPSAAYPLPEAGSWWDAPGYRTIPIETYDWACSAARRVENFVDFSHFPWVHPDVLGDRSKPLSPEHEIHDDGVTISFDIALEEPQASVKGDVAPGAKVQRDPTTYTLHMPLSVTLDQRLPPSSEQPDGNHFVLFLACAPLSAKHCRSFTWNARTYTLDPTADAELAAFQSLILDQDRPIAESQRPEELPVDLSQELHITGPDKASIAYRRRLAELAASARD
jgi:phenylpropionate dioxygenase-like ring-hydroxylating dioxygenase large terminal subunit